MDETKNDPQVDDAKTSKKRKTRRGTRGKGRKINYKKDNEALKTNEDEDQNASRASTGRPREEGLRNQRRNEEEQRKSQAETLRPSERTKRPPYQQWTQRHEERREMHQWKGEQRSQQVFAVKDDRKNWSHDHRQVSHHRRVQEQRDRGSVSQHGGKERDRGTRERSRVESTHQTERDGDGGRWRHGREWRLRRPYWLHD